MCICTYVMYSIYRGMCVSVIASSPYYKLSLNEYCRSGCLLIKNLVSWWWLCKLGSVNEIFPDLDWSGKWGWENGAARQSCLRRVNLWINTAQQVRRSVLSDCVALDNFHYPCAVSHPFVKRRKYFTAYWENEIISACKVFANKVSDKHCKNPHLI